jgi:mannose-1-phosphate guanylyltransferase / mannose-6-phosphate isomerase
MAKIMPVIMCGGSGTRMWPESRESLPKQFIPLIGERSTFQAIAGVVGDPRCSIHRWSSPISIIAFVSPNN